MSHPPPGNAFSSSFSLSYFHSPRLFTLNSQASLVSAVSFSASPWQFSVRGTTLSNNQQPAHVDWWTSLLNGAPFEPKTLLCTATTLKYKVSWWKITSWSPSITILCSSCGEYMDKFSMQGKHDLPACTPACLSLFKMVKPHPCIIC